MTPTPGPVLIALDGTPLSPADALPVPEAETPSTGRAMQAAAMLAARRGSRLSRFFWSVLGAFVSLVVSVMAWDFITGLFSRNETLGTIVLVLLAGLVLALTIVGIKELSAFARLKRLDDIRRAAEAAHASADLAAAHKIADRLDTLYKPRPDLRWGRDRMATLRPDVFDADGLLGLAETELLSPLDQAARREIEAAARQVALVTAFVPLALADVITALISNLRMIRRIAEIYGGRSGTLGSWRLTRSVLTHLLATGALAVGDDLIHSVAGGGLLSKLSRRFGEGVVNGALTARVGVAAMEVCRPLPFRALPKPRVTALVQRALTGLFGNT